MAGKAGHEAPTVTATHNSQARSDALAEALEELYALDQRIAEIVEDQIKDLRDAKSEIKAGLYENYGMRAKLVQARYAIYRMQKDAIARKDDITLDAISEAFRVLPPGEQGSLLPGLDKAGTIKTEGGEESGEPVTDAEGFAKNGGDQNKAYERGYATGLAGEPIDKELYAGRGMKKLRAQYENGYSDGATKLTASVGKSESEQIH